MHTMLTAIRYIIIILHISRSRAIFEPQFSVKRSYFKTRRRLKWSGTPTKTQDTHLGQIRFKRKLLSRAFNSGSMSNVQGDPDTSTSNTCYASISSTPGHVPTKYSAMEMPKCHEVPYAMPTFSTNLPCVVSPFALTSFGHRLQLSAVCALRRSHRKMDTSDSKPEERTQRIADQFFHG